MGASPPTPPRSSSTSRWLVALIILVGVAAYANSFTGVFLFDDARAIVTNPRIQHPLASWREILTAIRPVITLSLAFNYALGGLHVWSYHLVNLLIHISAALALYGLVRRTLELPQFQPRYGLSAPWFAASVALFWEVHPLQTESVTYIIQRGESLMGLCYLLTLYCLLRGATSGRRGWYVFCVVVCALGMGSKEVMATAPLVALLYDRVFLAPSWVAVLRQRGLLYLALFATGAVLIIPLQIAFGVRPDLAGGGGVGFHVEHLTPPQYALNEAGVILYYLRLVFWPHPLVLDYQWPVSQQIQTLVPSIIAVLLLIAATGYALWRWPALGFLGCAFFVILAPTSSIMPIVDLAFEHRMYLSLAVVIILIILAGDQLLAWLVRHGDLNETARHWLGTFAVAVAALALALATWQRNADYHSEIAIWRSVVSHRPDNERGHYNLGVALAERGDIQGAADQFARVLQLNPDNADAHANLGLALAHQGRWDQAIQHYHAALDRNPHHPIALLNLGTALAQAGDFTSAIDHFRAALAVRPDDPNILFNLGQAYLNVGNIDEAINAFTGALKLRPNFPEAARQLDVARRRQLIIYIECALACILQVL